MRDKYKYLTLITGRKERLALLKSVAAIRTAKLKPVVAAFSANVRRSSAVSVAYAEIAWQSRRDQACMNYAEFKTHGKIEPALTQLRKDKSASVACRLEYRNQYEECQSIDREELGQMIVHWGAGWVQVMVDTAPGMTESVEALLSSVVIASWATFENLASDLWVKAVNIGGPVLKERLKAAHKGQWLTPDDNIGVRELAEIDTRKFGSALRDIGRVSFQRLEYIKRFYSLAFDHDFDKFFKSVDGGYIQALSAIRNVLVHNAGKVDKGFLKQVQPFPELRSLKMGKAIRLDGKNVKRLENVSHELGAKLIHFVDKVITPKAKP